MLNIANDIITITKGDSAYLNFALTSWDGTSYEMQEGDRLRLTVRVQASADRPVLLEGQSDNSTIILSPAQTGALKPGKYSYDVQLETSVGDVFTIIGAESTSAKLDNFIVVPEVTV